MSSVDGHGHGVRLSMRSAVAAARPICHHKRQSVEAHLTIVFAAPDLTARSKSRLDSRSGSSSAPPLPHHRNQGRPSHRRRHRPLARRPPPRRRNDHPSRLSLRGLRLGRAAWSCHSTRATSVASSRETSGAIWLDRIAKTLRTAAEETARNSTRALR